MIPAITPRTNGTGILLFKIWGTVANLFNRYNISIQLQFRIVVETTKTNAVAKAREILFFLVIEGSTFFCYGNF